MMTGRVCCFCFGNALPPVEYETQFFQRLSSLADAWRFMRILRAAPCRSPKARRSEVAPYIPSLLPSRSHTTISNARVARRLFTTSSTRLVVQWAVTAAK